MIYNKDRAAEMVLALLYLTAFEDGFATRAWKSLDWDILDDLFQKGCISDPKSKAKSVVFTEKGLELAKQMFDKHLG
jgi:hypothetical protein